MVKKNLHLIIISEDSDFFNWIASTVKMSNIIIKNMIHHDAKSISTIQTFNNAEQLIIIEGQVYAKYLKNISQLFAITNNELPLLVVTETYTEITNKTNNLSIIDTIVKPSLSIDSLEHAILSLLKDYKLTQKLKKLAHFDALTGAANRYLFEDRIVENLKRSKRYKEPFSLLYFDLNGFKSVNDQHGHVVGDLLLKQFVKQLNKVKRETDTIARLGGDEFCMLFPNTNVTNIEKLTAKIINALSSPFILSGIELMIKTAIGGINIQDHSTNPMIAKDILKRADKCVYKAKKFKETHVILEVI